MTLSPLSYLNFSGRPALPLIRQTEAAECGLACLAMVAGYHGHDIDLNSLRRRYPLSLKGATLKSLIATAGHLDLAPRPLRAELAALPKLRLPAVLHWDMNHFVVLKQATPREIVIHDPARGEQRLSTEEASRHFTGVALELQPTASFERKDDRARMRLTDLWSRASGLGRAIAQTLILSVVLQMIVLAMPFYMQIVVDEVLTKFDTDLLVVIALGFGLLALINAAASALRQYVILYASNQLGFQMVANLFRHLLRLPLPWFEKRHMGDVLSRFSSTQPIRDLFTEGLVAAAIDGVMAIATLVFLFVYSAKLGLVVLVALGLYIALRIGFYRPFRRRSEDRIIAMAKEQSMFMESVRGIQSVKLFARESEREAVWQNRYADSINAGVRLGKLTISFDVANKLLFGLENVVVVYLGAKLVLDQSLSIGMLFAFMAYKQQFIEKAAALVGRAIEFRLLDLHLERLADIGFAAQEPDIVSAPTRTLANGAGAEFRGAIAAEGLSFRYAEGEAWVLKDASFTIAPGEFAVFIGPSGGGKTTLMKLLLGLFEPEEGRILIDGLPLAQFGRGRYRATLGAVMQEDALLSGSIADNISFFDPEPDHDRIERCARDAAVHDEIAMMPMGYDSLIGDMGTVLSGGQKQRVLLARALYRHPGILFLDEGTANLDPMSEARILDHISALPITRISVAHREAMIGRADRLFLVAGGSIQEIDPKSLHRNATRDTKASIGMPLGN